MACVASAGGTACWAKTGYADKIRHAQNMNKTSFFMSAFFIALKLS